MCLIAAVRVCISGGTWGVHQADDGNGAVGILLDLARRQEVMFRHPFAAAHSAILGDEANRANFVVEVHVDDGGVEGGFAGLGNHLAKFGNGLWRGGALGVLGGADDGLDVGIDVDVVEIVVATRDVGIRENAAQGWMQVALLVWEQRGVLRQVFGNQEQPIAGGKPACHQISTIEQVTERFRRGYNRRTL